MFYRNLTELKTAYETKKLSLREDEELKDGLPYCKLCGGKRYFDRSGIAGWTTCECLAKRRQQEQEAYEKEKRKNEYIHRLNLSNLRQRYLKLKFSDLQITQNNREIIESSQNYVKNAIEVLKNNIGLYVYGDNSTGKTFLTSVMCNELLRRGFRCLYVNFADILDDIRQGFNGGNAELAERFCTYQFVFLDDVGKEFIGREYDTTSAKWAEEKFFEIINQRYNAQLPTVFSSNYSIGELANVLKLDVAITERINEMSTIILKMRGDDFRSKAIKDKTEIAKKLGI